MFFCNPREVNKVVGLYFESKNIIKQKFSRRIFTIFENYEIEFDEKKYVLIDFTLHGFKTNLNLQKGWKPFAMISPLRGLLNVLNILKIFIKK